MQVRQRSFPSGLMSGLPSAEPTCRRASGIGMLRGSWALHSPMPVPVYRHHVVEERPVTVRRGTQLVQQIREMRHMVVVRSLDLGDLLHLSRVVRDGMVHVGTPISRIGACR